MRPQSTVLLNTIYVVSFCQVRPVPITSRFARSPRTRVWPWRTDGRCRLGRPRWVYFSRRAHWWVVSGRWERARKPRAAGRCPPLVRCRSMALLEERILGQRRPSRPRGRCAACPVGATRTGHDCSRSAAASCPPGKSSASSASPAALGSDVPLAIGGYALGDDSSFAHRSPAALHMVIGASRRTTTQTGPTLPAGKRSQHRRAGVAMAVQSDNAGITAACARDVTRRQQRPGERQLLASARARGGKGRGPCHKIIARWQCTARGD